MTPNGSPEWAASQGSPWVTVSEAMRRTERGANFYVVVDQDLTAPPGSCADGATYIVDAPATGAWAGHEGDLAVAAGANAANGWYFREQEEGLFAWVQDENLLYYIDVGSSPPIWAQYVPGVAPGALDLDDLGDVNTTGVADGYALVYESDSPAGWRAAEIKPLESLIVAVGDETTPITAGSAKVTFRAPCAMVMDSVKASLTTAQTSGGQVQVNIEEGGASILSTPIIFDNGSKTSVGSSPQPVISDIAIADDAELTIDIDNVGDGTAAGLKVTLKFRRA